MKSLNLIALALLTTLLIASCKKGDTGPVGPQGATGATGATGTSGISSRTFTINTSDWSNQGTSGVAGAVQVATISDPDILVDVTGTSTVLVFVANNGGYTALPTTYYPSAGVSATLSYAFSNGAVTLNTTYSDYTFRTLANGVIYRVVVIQGSNKKAWPIDLKDYNAVKDYFHLVD